MKKILLLLLFLLPLTGAETINYIDNLEKYIYSADYENLDLLELNNYINENPALSSLRTIYANDSLHILIEKPFFQVQINMKNGQLISASKDISNPTTKLTIKDLDETKKLLKGKITMKEAQQKNLIKMEGFDLFSQIKSFFFNAVMSIMALFS